VVRFYNAARINLNISAWSGGIDSGINLRIFDVPACGGFLMRDYTEELPEVFKIREEIEAYQSLEEMRDTLKYYLNHDGVREKIALKGYERVRKDHTFHQRMLELLQIVKNG
jgi:spore maturation protein CgeB